ncbi:MAG: TonB family protein [Kiritimatiellae bacterium]|nr:TonB family protein [Kiritimatiellia bacterium]
MRRVGHGMGGGAERNTVRGWKASLVLHGAVLLAVAVVPLLKGCATKKPPEELIFVEFTVAVPPAPAESEPEPEKVEEDIPEPEPESDPEPIPEPEPPKPEPPKPEPPKPPPPPKKREIVKQTNRVVRPNAPVPQGPVLTEEQIRKALAQGAKIGPVTSIPADADQRAMGKYFNDVERIMKAGWVQPRDLATLPGMQCVVELHVDKGGRITAASIIGPSGNASMDASVQKVLDKRPALPAPPVGATRFTVTFCLD